MKYYWTYRVIRKIFLCIEFLKYVNMHTEILRFYVQLLKKNYLLYIYKLHKYIIQLINFKILWNNKMIKYRFLRTHLYTFR